MLIHLQDTYIGFVWLYVVYFAIKNYLNDKIRTIVSLVANYACELRYISEYRSVLTIQVVT